MRRSWFEWACALFLLVALGQWAVVSCADLLPRELAALDLSPLYGLFILALALWLAVGQRRPERGS